VITADDREDRGGLGLAGDQAIGVEWSIDGKDNSVAISCRTT
jgi:hypothetical protein